jgi:hypothetical protein
MQCDGCRIIGPVPPVGWLFLIRQDDPVTAGLAGLLGNGGSDVLGAFCTFGCLADYAMAHALDGHDQRGDTR